MLISLVVITLSIIPLYQGYDEHGNFYVASEAESIGTCL